jgi:galactokinase
MSSAGQRSVAKTQPAETHAFLRETFENLFERAPRLYRAPGRVNLIGEHTDYNEGLVMPAAIGLYCWVAIDSRTDRKLRVHSTNFSETITIDLDGTPRPRQDWSDYVVGTALSLGDSGARPGGADILVHGEVPLGSGLSSSAAIEVATGYALLDLSGLPIDLVQLALACRKAENEFVGARVGLMDQFISSHGKRGHAMMLDCRSLETEPVPIPQDVQLIVCNTGVKHQLAAGEYNARRAQCEEGVRRLSSVLPQLHSLRDLTLSQLENHKGILPEVIYRRCRHVVTENERVQSAVRAFIAKDHHTVGSLMAASHESLRDDYEVSCAELNAMVEIARAQPGIVGARMTGGGFGGCTINLVKRDSADSFERCVKQEYENRFKIHPDIYLLDATDGVCAVPAEA